MGKEDIVKAKVGDMVGIHSDIFKATALIIDEKETKEFGRYFICLILSASEYEYNHINVFVKPEQLESMATRWYRIKTEE